MLFLPLLSLGKRSTTFLFARGTDQAISYRQADAAGWTTEWTSLGGVFLSPPSSLSIRDGRIDVFAVDKTQALQVKTFQDGKWDSKWKNLYGACSSQPTSVSFGIDKLSLLCVDADHRPQLQYYKGGWRENFREWSDLGAWLSSTPALASGASGYVDVVAYGVASRQDEKTQQGSDLSMIYKRYNTTTWLDWEGGWGSFTGDPAMVAVDETQLEYFGIDKNGTMWHNTRLLVEEATTRARRSTGMSNLPSEYTDPESLGGNFTSTPFAFATGSSRIDVLAVGDDGRLKHQARIEKDWANDWEDLGGYLSSAPLALSFGNSSNVTVFGTEPNGTDHYLDNCMKETMNERTQTTLDRQNLLVQITTLMNSQAEK
ncbi:hypothetical protein QQX98_005033 [Neonectria punicea]|uniref:PLL-like beta propeller domain-containing protein n=1 Tax=Neonectria punicea TaxID=979145 RepID=A0ABR1H6Y2_9HYPO